jgi:pimeloyl-ACP methyl ester carboxylesterase
MTGDAVPPVRQAHTWRAPGGSWSYDTWGGNGRPVILIHSILFDRAMWWPAAAELRTDCTVIAVDLPGHGTSPGRARYDPAVLVAELAQLLHELGATQAPVVVGHGTSSGLAALFATRFVAHAVITVDAAAGFCPPISLDAVNRYLATMAVDRLPSHFRTLVTARPDHALLAGYLARMPDALHSEVDIRPEKRPHSAPSRQSHLAVHSQRPVTGDRHPVRSFGGQWRSAIYDVPGHFAHLADVQRFAADVRSVL